jgi:AcrR family transcriptional regulator
VAIGGAPRFRDKRACMTRRKKVTSRSRGKKAPEKLPSEDERVRRSKEAVLGTAFEMLSQTGLGGFSIDEVSRRSGVAKMTIYRHWPSRSALLLDACTRMAQGRSNVPDTGSFAGDLLELGKDVAGRMQTGRWSSLLPSIIDAAERDPELAELHARQQAAVTSAFRTIIERAKGRKQLAPRTDAATVIALVMGPLVYRRWFSRERIDDAFIALIVKNVLHTLARPVS